MLCRHVQAVILYLASEANMVEVSFWTREGDAERQHRRTLSLQTKDTLFWVTYNWPSEIHRTGDKIVKVQADPWRVGQVDAYYQARDGRSYRMGARR